MKNFSWPAESRQISVSETFCGGINPAMKTVAKKWLYPRFALF
jgi:hypothetical protein